MARKKQLSIFFWSIAGVIVAMTLVVVACNAWVIHSTGDRVYRSVADLAADISDPIAVGLVLGTSKKVAPNTPNRHFENRMAAAAALFESGKVAQLLVSGHRESKYYDETRDMIEVLVGLGVPKANIVADDLGARTFESVARARAVFGFDEAVIVSDDFHVGRALFIADRLGLKAVALCGEPVEFSDSRGVRMREYLARVKAVLDCALAPSG